MHLAPSRFTWLALALVLLNAPNAQAFQDSHRPAYYAITDVRIVTGTGEILETGTVLLAEGLIEAVGTAVAVPPDAWVIDGTGLTLFPGLVDALSTLGIKQDEGSAGPAAGGRRGGGAGADGPTIRGPEDRPQTTPWQLAADMLGDDGRVEQWREAGFTSAVTAPADGLFCGQAAFINLGESEPRERLVAAAVAQRLNLRSPGSRSYPGSLMGVIAYIGQVFSDTRHYRELQALYDATPLGRERPVYDRTMEPLAVALERRQPFLIPAHLPREIDRALALAEESALVPVIYGGQGAYASIEHLAASETPVLVSLNWPEAEKDRDPEADTALRTLIHRRLAVTTPMQLQAAGVPFAFYSDGLGSTSKVFAGVRAAVEAGLDREAALAALTSGAARIFGVADQLGTIEPGKIANLVLATDEPWAEDAEIRIVFVDGIKYEEPRDDEPTEPPAMNIAGTWTLNLETPGGSRELTAELEMTEDGKVTGEIRGERGTNSVEEGRMSADLLRFKVTRTMGARTMQASYNLTVENENLSGTMNAGPRSMDISGTRTAAPAAVAADSEGEESEEQEEAEVTLAELSETQRVIQGPVRAPFDFAIRNARVYTVSGETIENGTVVVQGGKITAVGADIEVPAGVEVIDAEGGSLIPGIIDCHSHIAIDGGGNEGSLAVTSMVSIGDVLNPDDINIYRALAGGVTCANILHGSANPIGGRNAVIKLRWGSNAEGLKVAGAAKGIKFALGENPKRSNSRGGRGGTRRYPATRMGVMDVIRQAFLDARDYRNEWQTYEAGLAAGEQPNPPRRDFKLEALVEIMEGERLVHSHCYRADEILQLLRLAEEFDFRVATLQHVLEGYKIADEIAAHGAGASTFSDWWGYKTEAYNAIPHNAALMTERGVLVSINSDSAEEMRHLNQEAAKTMKWGGLGEVEALSLVTLNPARQLGIDDRVGSIEVGKDADLVLYDGLPLTMQAVVQKTFVDGQLYFDREADRARQAKIEDVKSRLLPKSGADAEDKQETEGQAVEASSEIPDAAPPKVRWQAEVICSCRRDG